MWFITVRNYCFHKRLSVHGGGGHAWQRGAACVAKGGIRGKGGGHVW